MKIILDIFFWILLILSLISIGYLIAQTFGLFSIPVIYFGSSLYLASSGSGVGFFTSLLYFFSKIKKWFKNENVELDGDKKKAILPKPDISKIIISNDYSVKPLENSPFRPKIRIRHGEPYFFPVEDPDSQDESKHNTPRATPKLQRKGFNNNNP